jgi:hypothetical protein
MEVNCVSSECDGTIEHGVKAKDTFTHDRIYFPDSQETFLLSASYKRVERSKI